MDFAVTGNWIEEGKGLWVLAVDPVGERFLLAEESGALVWRPIAECKFARAATPDMPRLVMPVQQQSPIVTPSGMLKANGRH